jgi:hypothetical protein
VLTIYSYHESQLSHSVSRMILRDIRVRAFEELVLLAQTWPLRSQLLAGSRTGRKLDLVLDLGRRPRWTRLLQVSAASCARS